MVCSSSTTRDLLHGALLLVEQLRFLNELNAGTMAPRRRDDDDDMVSLSLGRLEAWPPPDLHSTVAAAVSRTGSRFNGSRPGLGVFYF
jgi:hypothetical protein